MPWCDVVDSDFIKSLSGSASATVTAVPLCCLLPSEVTSIITCPEGDRIVCSPSVVPAPPENHH